MCRCFVCDRPISGRVGDPRICVAVDKGDGAVGSIVVCAKCGPLTPAGRQTEDAQALLDGFAMRMKRVRGVRAARAHVNTH